MLHIEAGGVGYNFKKEVEVRLVKKGIFEPVLGGKRVMRKSGEIFPRQMDYQGKCPKQRYYWHFPGTARISLPLTYLHKIGRE